MMIRMSSKQLNFLVVSACVWLQVSEQMHRNEL